MPESKWPLVLNLVVALLFTWISIVMWDTERAIAVGTGICSALQWFAFAVQIIPLVTRE
jgi:hypothetical protein